MRTGVRTYVCIRARTCTVRTAIVSSQDGVFDAQSFEWLVKLDPATGCHNLQV